MWQLVLKILVVIIMSMLFWHLLEIVLTFVYRGGFQSLAQGDPAPDKINDDYLDQRNDIDLDDGGDLDEDDENDEEGDDDEDDEDEEGDLDEEDDEGHQTYYGRTWDLFASWYGCTPFPCHQHHHHHHHQHHHKVDDNHHLWADM